MNIPSAQTLSTNRLFLREMNPDIYNEVMGNFSDEEIKKYFGMKTDTSLESEKARFQSGVTMTGRSFLYFHLLERETNNVIGWCGYHTWFTGHRRAEIGYELNDDSHKGKGYMKEAIFPVLKYGFENMNLHRVEALIAPWNIPSIKLVLGSGFVQEGLLREHYVKNDKVEDSVIYGLLKPDFYKVNPRVTRN